MSEFDDMNREVVAEFRSNQGVVDTAAGGYFKGKPMLILHTTGAKTGAERANPHTAAPAKSVTSSPTKPTAP